MNVKECVICDICWKVIPPGEDAYDYRKPYVAFGNRDVKICGACYKKYVNIKNVMNMSRFVCFFSEDGQTAICINEATKVDCNICPYNPWAGKPIPKDRVLREP